MIPLDFFSALPIAEAEFTGVFAIREKVRELTTFFPFIGPHHAPPTHKTHTMTFTILRGGLRGAVWCLTSFSGGTQEKRRA